MSEREKRLSWWMIALAIALAIPTLYVGAYPLLGQLRPSSGLTIEREFHFGLIARLYMPVGMVESKLRGAPVAFSWDDSTDPFGSHRTSFDAKDVSVTFP